MYPHIRISQNLVKGFRWMPVDRLHRHERTAPAAIAALVEHIRGRGGNNQTPPTIPAVLACDRSLAIIDGHHRFEALKALGLPYVPTLLIDYEHADIRLNPASGTMTKADVVAVALDDRQLLEPKQTAHLVREMRSLAWLPLPVLSPICPIQPPKEMIPITAV